MAFESRFSSLEVCVQYSDPPAYVILSVCVCVCEGGRQRERKCVCVCEGGRQRERKCVCVCACVCKISDPPA